VFRISFHNTLFYQFVFFGAKTCCTIKRVPLRCIFCMRLSPCASGAGWQGRVMMLGNIQSTLPAGHPLFLSLRTAHLYRQRRKWMIFMGPFFVLGLITLFISHTGVLACSLVKADCHSITLVGHIMRPLLGLFLIRCDKCYFLLALRSQ